MCFYCQQPLPVSRRNWQILLREQSKRSLLKLPSSMSVHKNLAGIPAQPCYLSPGGRAHVCALACVCQRDLFMCAFPHKARGVTEQIARGRPTSALCLPTKACGGTAELAFASIFLIADVAGEAVRPVLFFPQGKLSPPVQ